MSTAASPAGPAAEATEICLPTFWMTRPELWFAHAEAVFRNRTPPVTTDQVKYNHVLPVLPNEVLEKIEHIILGKDPVGGRYLALKDALTESYGRREADGPHPADRKGLSR